MIRLIYRPKIISIILISLGLIINSCDFRIVKHVGRQYSSEIKWSKEFNVFFCSYKPDNKTIEKHNKYRINQIFAEYQYRHDGGFFSGFDIDKNAAQIIITDSIEGMTWQKDSCSFGFVGFETWNGYLHCKFNNTTFMPDTLKLELVIVDFKSNNKETEEMIYLKDK